MDVAVAEAEQFPVMTIRCQHNPSARVRLLDPQFPFQDETVFAAEAQADGLHARVEAVTVGIWDQQQLDGFLDTLAADFRGWNGERQWISNHLLLRARFASGGHVGLTWTLRPLTPGPDCWQASVTTWLEAGEQMTNLAADIRAFLHPQPAAPG